MNGKSQLFFMFAILILLVQACNLPGPSQPAETVVPTDMPTLEPPPTEAPVVQRQVFPVSAPESKLFYDVDSASTAPEKRAPYGDSYDINRLERPFLQDMTYIPDLDIRSFSISQTSDWYYVSMGLVGIEPNNSLGINYGVELDLNSDGFGDFVILAVPPYSSDWTAENVRIYADNNHNTAGVSSAGSDAPFNADGYETQVFDGNGSLGDDPDLAWVRINAGPYATVQFAFKKSWAGDTFMFGTFADAGLKDVTMLDYVDRFTEHEAGSPVKDKQYYPLGVLFAIDNTCQEAQGFQPTGYEPKLCPPEATPTKEPGGGNPPGTTPEPSCTNTCPFPGQDPYPSCLCWPG